MPIPQWLQNGKDKYRGLTHKQIDCSHLLHRVLKDSGCTVKYLTTGTLNDDENEDRNKYYDKIDDNSKMKPGDIILFEKHVGIVESYDPKTRTGKFFGSQTSTGPASTDFGPGTIKGWNKSFNILRPKPQYCPKTSSLRDDDASDKIAFDDSDATLARVNAATGLTSDDEHITEAAAGKGDSGLPGVVLTFVDDNGGITVRRPFAVS